MNKRITPVIINIIALIMSLIPTPAQSSTISLKIAYTTDVHGNFFPYNYITRTHGQGSMARVASAIDSLRAAYGNDRIVLLDNGDILQGQPTVYYYNYIDTITRHPASEIYNYLKYDAFTIGNHDVETGHAVYDRWIAQSKAPALGANVIDTSTGQPYLKPYHIIERCGIKIAVLGMLTPAIPAWLPEVLWQGLHFDDMETTAEKWIRIIREKEHPHIIIGLFHSGHDASRMTGKYQENASVKVAENVPGFDLVLIGHDHQLYKRTITNCDGKPVEVLNPANNANAIGVADITVTLDADGNVSDKSVTTEIMDVTGLNPSEDFMRHFELERQNVYNFVDRQIGEASDSMATRDAFFGPSAFMTLLHRLQLQISGADISFAAPLSFDAVIAKGPLRVSDMFTLYKYENMLYVMRLTGSEIKNYLEESYSLWTRQLTDSSMHLINFKSDCPTLSDNRLANPSYNFDSAAGITYTVDVTKPKGQKIAITSTSSGEPFDPDRSYLVAVNSYRANGGGDLLTKGAGIPAEELASRIVSATDKDLRYYLLKAIEKQGMINAEIDANWKFIPEQLVTPAARRDRQLLFSPESSKEQK